MYEGTTRGVHDGALRCAQVRSRPCASHVQPDLVQIRVSSAPLDGPLGFTRYASPTTRSSTRGASGTCEPGGGSAKALLRPMTLSRDRAQVVGGCARAHCPAPLLCSHQRERQLARAPQQCMQLSGIQLSGMRVSFL